MLLEILFCIQMDQDFVVFINCVLKDCVRHGPCIQAKAKRLRFEKTLHSYLICFSNKVMILNVIVLKRESGHVTPCLKFFNAFFCLQGKIISLSIIYSDLHFIFLCYPASHFVLHAAGSTGSFPVTILHSSSRPLLRRAWRFLTTRVKFHTEASSLPVVYYK